MERDTVARPVPGAPQERRGGRQRCWSRPTVFAKAVARYSFPMRRPAMGERGVSIDHSTNSRRMQKYAPECGLQQSRSARPAAIAGAYIQIKPDTAREPFAAMVVHANWSSAGTDPG